MDNSDNITIKKDNVDLNEFVTLNTATIRSRYPAILKLYKYRISNDKRNRDAFCVGCSKVIVKSKVSRLIGHAKKCSNSDQSLVKQLETSYKSVEAQKSGIKVEKKSRPEVRKLQKTYDDQILELLAVNSLPLDLINSKELNNIFLNIDSCYQLPTRERVNALLTSKASSEINKSLNKLKEADNYTVNLKLIGHSPSGLMAVIVTSHAGHSTLLDLIDISNDPDSSTNLAAKALDAIRNSKIPDQKFNSIISDDTRSFMLARDIIYEDFNNGRMIEYRSFAHVLNKMTGSITKSLMLKESFNNLYRLIKAISRNKHIVLKLREKGQTKLSESLPTSKTIPSACVNYVLQNKSNFQRMPKTERYNPTLWESIVSNESFWADLEKIKPYLDKITATIQEASYKKLSDAFSAFLELGRFIFQEVNLDTSVKDLITEAFVTHFNQLDYHLLLAAYVLDPNKRLAYLTNRAVREVKEYIAKLLATMGHKDDVTKVAMNEFKRYTTDLPNDNITDVLGWWASGDTVILKLIAMRLAACPSSVDTQSVSTAIESNLAQHGLNISVISDILALKIAQISTKKPDNSLEAPLLCPDVINYCVELIEDSANFYESTSYIEFRNLIDYASTARFSMDTV